jgi:hypothetical protein
MKYIKLNKNKRAMVDNKDYDWVSTYKWYANPHAGGWRALTGKGMSMHRLIMGFPVGLEVDHINGNQLDNRRLNLRVCTKTQNLQNSKLSKDSKNKYKGITFVKRYKIKPWKASIMLNGKRYWLGQYATQEDAGSAYDKKAVELFGEFARLNFPKVYQQGWHARDKSLKAKYILKQVKAEIETMRQTGRIYGGGSGGQTGLDPWSENNKRVGQTGLENTLSPKEPVKNWKLGQTEHK